MQHASSSSSPAKKQCLTSAALINSPQGHELDLKKNSDRGDYDSFLQLINFYFTQHRLDDIATELHDLIDEGEVRPSDIVNLERLGDAYAILCNFEQASKWYDTAENEALTHALMYNKDFRAQEIGEKIELTVQVLRQLRGS